MSTVQPVVDLCRPTGDANDPRRGESGALVLLGFATDREAIAGDGRRADIRRRRLRRRRPASHRHPMATSSGDPSGARVVSPDDA